MGHNTILGWMTFIVLIIQSKTGKGGIPVLLTA